VLVMNYNSSLVDQFNEIILLATLTTLVPYVLSAAAQLHLLATDRALFSGRRLARDAVIATLALVYATAAIWGAGQEIIAKGFMLLLVGIPVYVWLQWRRARAAEAAGPPEPPLEAPPGQAWQMPAHLIPIEEADRVPIAH
jgi:basic amino acid/polyamine antiporter, APA family